MEIMSYQVELKILNIYIWIWKYQDKY
jgi:hypothetical protein